MKLLQRLAKRRLTTKNIVRAVEIYLQNAYREDRKPTFRSNEEIAQELIDKLEGRFSGYKRDEAEDRLGADQNGNSKITVFGKRWLIFGKGYELGYNKNCRYYDEPELINAYQQRQTEIEDRIKEAWREESFPVVRKF
jgi:hypothetical protein